MASNPAAAPRTAATLLALLAWSTHAGATKEFRLELADIPQIAWFVFSSISFLVLLVLIPAAALALRHAQRSTPSAIVIGVGCMGLVLTAVLGIDRAFEGRHADVVVELPIAIVGGVVAGYWSRSAPNSGFPWQGISIAFALVLAVALAFAIAVVVETNRTNELRYEAERQREAAKARELAAAAEVQRERRNLAKERRREEREASLEKAALYGAQRSIHEACHTAITADPGVRALAFRPGTVYRMQGEGGDAAFFDVVREQGVHFWVRCGLKRDDGGQWTVTAVSVPALPALPPTQTLPEPP